MTIANIMIFIVILITVLYCIQNICKYFSDKKWRDKPIRNFKFNYKGKEFWYSRSCAVTLFVITKDSKGEWCILANKRGDNAPDYNGFWNVPCGYVDFDENGEEAAQRECYEETNVFIPLEYIKFNSINTEPSNNKQNISIQYVSIFDDIDLTTSFTLSDRLSEDGEVSEIQWIPISKINEYNWAFEHDILINNLVEQKLN